jgi:hypothetical protein
MRQGRIEAEMAARVLYRPADNAYARSLQEASGLFQ